LVSSTIARLLRLSQIVWRRTGGAERGDLLDCAFGGGPPQ
jgi:hypothetical protein